MAPLRRVFASKFFNGFKCTGDSIVDRLHSSPSFSPLEGNWILKTAGLSFPA